MLVAGLGYNLIPASESCGRIELGPAGITFTHSGETPTVTLSRASALRL
ncbi:MAG: hypothetical protein ACOVMN_08800 [Flexibacteraceae bacterium]